MLDTFILFYGAQRMRSSVIFLAVTLLHQNFRYRRPHPFGGVGELGPHEQEGFREESPEQPISLFADAIAVIFRDWINAKPAAWGPAEFPTPPG